MGPFEEIRITVDSGAVDHVAPRSVARHLEVKETLASKAGVKYIAANGSSIFNEGEKHVTVATLDGKSFRNMTFQVAQVNKALGSVSQIVVLRAQQF